MHLLGGMVGLERTIFPEFAFENFGISSYVAILSFITAFGLSKAITNYFRRKTGQQFWAKKPSDFRLDYRSAHPLYADLCRKLVCRGLVQWITRNKSGLHLEQHRSYEN
jgi:hypothetical protein